MTGVPPTLQESVTVRNERLKALIREKGFTYQTLADEIGLTSGGAIAEIVAGRTCGPTARYAVAKALGVEVKDIWPEGEIPDEAGVGAA